MNSYEFEKICKNAIIKEFNSSKDKTDKFELRIEDVYVVWSCKTLQNNKALLSTTVPDNMYYECTYNGNKNELYLDAYRKQYNKCIISNNFDSGAHTRDENEATCECNEITEDPLKESSAVSAARYELNLLLESCKDSEDYLMQKQINDNVMEIIEKFYEVGHSGMSADYEIGILNRLLRQQNLTPLTLKDDEFIEISPGVFQNKRDSRIFKQADKFDGKPYNVDTKTLYDVEKGN